jgi:hypothetical protein
MFSIWIPQFAAFLAAFLATWGAKKGFDFDPEVLTATFVGIFTIVKTIVARYANPGNVAAPELVDQPKDQVRAVRRASGNR